MGKKTTFTRLRLRNWKNFPELDLPLQDRVFLTGPNASGKSNLLDAFRFLRDLASPGGGLQRAVEHRGGIEAIRCLAVDGKPDVELSVEAKLQGSSRWVYELGFSQDGQGLPVVRKERVLLDGETILDRPSGDDRTDPARLSQTHLEQVTANRSFRELGGFFSSLSFSHIEPQLVREPDRSGGRTNDPFGSDFVRQVASTPKELRESRLCRIQKALRAAVPQLESFELVGDRQGKPHLRCRFEHWSYQAAWHTENQLSDGTIRLVGLLWAVLDGKGPLLLEEAEMSLHPEVVRHLPQLLARSQRKTGRQVLVSTHSLVILRDEGLGEDEVLRLAKLD